MLFSAPIYNKDKEIQGVVVANYPINKINDVFNKIVSPHAQTESNSNSINIDLVSKNGTIIFSNHDRKSILHTKPEIQQLIRDTNKCKPVYLYNINNYNSFNNNYFTNSKEYFFTVIKANEKSY